VLQLSTLWFENASREFRRDTGDGYRYDHAHCTLDLASKLLAGNYIHQPRLNRLSNHSAFSVREQLITSESVPVNEPPTLF